MLKIQSLVEFKAQREDIQRLLVAAERNLNDAAVTAISDENRFDAAYKCVMQCAMECAEQAQGLLAHVRRWLAVHHPDFC